MNTMYAIALLALFACTNPESSSHAPAKAPAPAASDAHADLSSLDLAVQTQEEADRDAQQSIDEKNADAALEELEQEIEGGAPPKQSPLRR
jgi:uncharacterized membrane protein YccC